MLLLRAWFTLFGAAIRLTFAPQAVVRKELSKSVPTATSAPAYTSTQIAWAIAIASRFCPRGGNCLTQAIAAAALLRKSGLPAAIRLGVATGTEFAAHAWVESDGQIVVGAGEAAKYCALPLP